MGVWWRMFCRRPGSWRARPGAWVIAAALLSAGCRQPPAGPAPPRPEARAQHVAEALPESCRPDRRLGPTPRTARVSRPPSPTLIPVVRLTELEPRVEGRPRTPASRAFTLDREGLAAVQRSLDGDVARFVVSNLPSAARGATRLRLVMRAAGARSLRVTPTVPGERPYLRDRRTVRVDLGADPQADGDVAELQIDLGHAVTDNWRVRGRSGEQSMDGLRIELVGAASGAELLALSLEDEQAGLPDGLPRAALDRGGVTHPGFLLRAGASLVFPVTVPRAGALLSAYVDHRTGGTIEIAVRTAGRSAPLARLEAGGGFRAQRIPLPGLAGARVELVFSTDHDLGFLGAPELVPLASAAPDQERRDPDVLVYLVDMLLATQLGAFGNPRDSVSPTIDRLLREGLAFSRMRSSSPWTKPAVPTLLTGLHPSVHGVGAHDYLERLPPSVPRLHDRFRERGYRTASIAASPLGSTLSGLERGFDHVVTPAAFDRVLGPMGQPTAEQLHRRLLAFVDEEPERPFFAFVHSLDVHEYKAEYFELGAHADDRPYDRALRQQDRALGELLESLARRRREVLLVLVSDHGEAFGEYGRRGHGLSLHQSQLHVPLVFHFPGRLPATVVDDLVWLPDVAPSILDFFSLPPLPDVDGVSVMRYAFDDAPTPAHAFVTSSREWFPGRGDEPRLAALELADGTKAIAVEGGARWVFALPDDPCELAAPVGSGGPQHALELLEQERTRLARRALAFAARHGRERGAAMEADAVARLRALGYVH